MATTADYYTRGPYDPPHGPPSPHVKEHRDPRDRVEPIDLDHCPVCPWIVQSDPNGQRSDHTSPVQMEDGTWTHQGCVDGWHEAVERLARIHDGRTLEWGDVDLDVEPRVSAQSRYVEEQAARAREGAGEPSRITRSRP